MTTVFELIPPAPPSRTDEPPITVRADGAGVVIQPRPGQLDSGATAALVAVINAAVASGTAALIDLACGAPDPLPRVEKSGRERAGALPVARIAGPGLVELAAGAEPWLLDVVGSRLSRVRAEDRRFLPASAWLRVQAVTVSATMVGATTHAGDRFVVYRST